MKKIESVSSHPSIRGNLKLFSSELVYLCSTFEETGTQTCIDDCIEDNTKGKEDNILDDVLSLKDESMQHVLHNAKYHNLHNDLFQLHTKIHKLIIILGLISFESLYRLSSASLIDQFLAGEEM